jgi:hypothetical protein
VVQTFAWLGGLFLRKPVMMVFRPEKEGKSSAQEPYIANKDRINALAQENANQVKSGQGGDQLHK